jgi:hypothetical protein
MLPFLTVRSTSIVYQETVIRMLEETSEFTYKATEGAKTTTNANN